MVKFRPFSFSTSWNAKHHKDALSLVKEIKKLGFERIELNFSLPKKIVDEIKDLVDKKIIIVTSVHNFCPLPEHLSEMKVYPDHYNLASPDEKIRGKAVELAKMTIETVKALKGETVVLHLGRVEIKDRTRDLAFLVGDEKSYPQMKYQMEKERMEKSPQYLENAIQSLKEISGHAKNLGVKIGIENRFYFREIPSLDELGIIMKEFTSKDNVFYWHDVGHAKVFENIGIVEPWEYLERFKDRLIGMHIHDVEFIDDHRAPGKGNFDFSRLIKYLKDDTLLVFEVHDKNNACDIVKGKEYLESLFALKLKL